MCGITGVLYRDGSRPDAALLRSMAQTIAHRGPDGEGVQVMAGCGLAHRRLAVIDLSPEAAQPMSAADGRVWVVFNGEIYNFLELRAQLEQLGHRFTTHGDTEVILAAYLQWGAAGIARLDGMFAIALWDTRTRELVLARDRTGKKPLYVYDDGKKVVFGSEIKAILAHPDINQRMLAEAIPQFLTHGYVPTPATFYERIRKVRPATYEVLTLTSREPRETQYWEYPLGRETKVSAKDLPEVEAKVRELFFAAVKKRMVADVPLGAFLSGGVDSTLVVAAMAQLSSKPVKTFSIGFEGYPEWDETKYARLVAERYGTDHTEFKVKPESFELIDKLAWHYDEPFGDSSAIPTYIVSKLTREHVTVALTGDGGDELFAGYPRFMGAVLAERMPKVLRSLAKRVVAPLPHGKEHQGYWERGRRFAMQASRDLPERLRAWVSVFAEDDLQALLRPDLQRFSSPSILGESYTRAFDRARDADVLNQVLYVNARTYLLDDLNVKMDRASMAASLEARAPFLDTQLIEYVSTLPGDLKLKGTTTKWILKRALKDLLPDDVVNRKKMGFGVPLGAWLRTNALTNHLTALENLSTAMRTAINSHRCQQLMSQHSHTKRDVGLQLWSLLGLARFLQNASSSPNTTS